jgi:hypothetical protein
VVLPLSILVQMMILNNLIDSIVLIKSIESLITMWFYPLNFHCVEVHFYFTFIVHEDTYRLHIAWTCIRFTKL